MGNYLRSLFRLIWPFVLLLLVAALLHIYDPWSIRDAIATVYFGVSVAIATAMLGLRQQALQQALADATLVATISSIRGSLEAVKRSFDSAAVMAVITKSRSGLPLLKYSEPWAREEFLEAAREASRFIDKDLRERLRARSTWAEDDWSQIYKCVKSFRSDLSEIDQSARRSVEGAHSCLGSLLENIEESLAVRESIPFKTFKSAYYRGDVHEKIRAMLDWDTLRDGIEKGDTALKVHRQWSVDWLGENDALTVWHATPKGDFCDFYEKSARPIALREVGRKFDILPDDTRATINNIAQTFNFRTNSSGLHIAEVVTLKLEDRLFILDGNHRMAAMVRGPQGHLGPLGVQVVEYRIVHNSDDVLVPEQLSKKEQARFHGVLQEVLDRSPSATPSDVWSTWRLRNLNGSDGKHGIRKRLTLLSSAKLKQLRWGGS